MYSKLVCDFQLQKLLYEVYSLTLYLTLQGRKGSEKERTGIKYCKEKESEGNKQREDVGRNEEEGRRGTGG